MAFLGVQAAAHMAYELSSQKLDGGWDLKDIHQGCVSESNLIHGVLSPESSPISLSSTRIQIWGLWRVIWSFC